MNGSAVIDKAAFLTSSFSCPWDHVSSHVCLRCHRWHRCCDNFLFLCHDSCCKIRTRLNVSLFLKNTKFLCKLPHLHKCNGVQLNQWETLSHTDINPTNKFLLQSWEISHVCHFNMVHLKISFSFWLLFSALSQTGIVDGLCSKMW